MLTFMLGFILRFMLRSIWGYFRVHFEIPVKVHLRFTFRSTGGSEDCLILHIQPLVFVVFLLCMCRTINSVVGWRAKVRGKEKAGFQYMCILTIPLHVLPWHERIAYEAQGWVDHYLRLLPRRFVVVCIIVGSLSQETQSFVFTLCVELRALPV